MTKQTHKRVESISSKTRPVDYEYVRTKNLAHLVPICYLIISLKDKAISTSTQCTTTPVSDSYCKPPAAVEIN